MDKKICDVCGKEIKQYGSWIYGTKWFMVINQTIEGDFCSDECLLRFIDKNIKIKSGIGRKE